MTGHHLLALAKDDECLLYLAQLMQDIINGRTSPMLREYITSSTLYPLVKGKNGIRPIAAGEVIKRAADAYMNERMAPVIRDLCEPYQFGICKPGGCEQVILATQALLDNPTRQTTAFLVDIENAFNTEDRSWILRTIYETKELKPMWGIVDYTYGSDSILRLPGGFEIRSRNGVKQGDTLGSAEFAMSKHSAYKTAHSVHPDSVRLFAVLDDATLVGPAQHTIDCVTKLEECIIEHGQRFNWSKCKFLSHHDNVLDAAVIEFLSSHNVPIIRDATTLLGGPIGWDRKKMAAMAMDVHRDSALLFEQILHPVLPVQEAMLILRSCAQPIPGYLSRVLPPEVLANAADAFDRQLLETAAIKLNLSRPLSPASVRQLQHRLGNSGFGLCSNSPIAYTCALAAAAPLLCHSDILPRGVPHPSSAFATDFIGAIQATREATLRKPQPVAQAAQPADQSAPSPPLDPAAVLLPPADDPTEANSLNWFADQGAGIAKPNAKLQHALSHIADRHRFRSLLQASKPADRARLLSCSAAGASAWQTAIPSDSSLRLHPRAYQAAARLRLGLPIHDDIATRCTCGHSNADPTIDKHHGLSCIKVRRAQVNFRHDMVKDAFHQWARRLGCPAIKEPKNLIKGQERGDNLIAFPGGDLVLCDVSIVQPSAPTHVDRGQDQLAVAEFAAAEKRKQYTPLAEQEGAKFVPLIAEVFGGLHEETAQFIKRLAWLADTDAACPWDRNEALIGITGAISVAIQLGNLMAFDRVQLNNRNAGLVPSRRQPVADEPLLLCGPDDSKLRPQANDVNDPSGPFDHDDDQPSPLAGQREIDPARRARVIIGRSHLRSVESRPICKASRRSQPRTIRPQTHEQDLHSQPESTHRRVIVNRLSVGSGRGRVTDVAARSRQFLGSRASGPQQAIELIRSIVHADDVDEPDDGLVLPEEASQRARLSLGSDADDAISSSFGSDDDVSAAGRLREAL